eukprot:6429718-Prymnesium_polylepis.2
MFSHPHHTRSQSSESSAARAPRPASATCTRDRSDDRSDVRLKRIARFAPLDVCFPSASLIAAEIRNASTNRERVLVSRVSWGARWIASRARRRWRSSPKQALRARHC